MPFLHKEKLHPEITFSNTFSFELKDIVDQEFVKNFRFTLNSIWAIQIEIGLYLSVKIHL